VWEGITEYPQLSVQTTGHSFLLALRSFSLIHSDITQETNTLSRLQRDYSSHPQDRGIPQSKVSATGLEMNSEKPNKFFVVKPVAE